MTSGRRPAVLFDLGDVLVRLRFDRGLARFEALAGRPLAALATSVFLSEHALRFNRGALSAAEFLDGLAAHAGIGLASREEVAEAWCDVFDPWPEMEALADEVLAAGHPVHVLSNTDELHLPRLRELVPVLGRVTGLSLSYELGVVKPDPAFFRLALARAGLAAGEALFVDDREEHVAAAEALGIRSLRHRGDVDEVRRFLREGGVAIRP